MPSINLSFTTSAFVVLLLVLIAGVTAAYFYRHTIPPIPRGKRNVLIILRALALSFLLIFLFEPLLRFISTSTQKPLLAVLVDDSKSMTIEDKTGDRSAQLKQLLGSDALNNVGRSGEIRYYTFGTKTRHIGQLQGDSLQLAEEATDITAALRKVAEEKERLNIGATLLISDGSYNLGQNPIYEAEQLGIPIYTVGIGDSTEQKDVLVTKVVTNELVYSQTEVPVDVTLKSSGYKSEKVEVVLVEEGKELSRAQIMLEEGTREYAVRLLYTPEGEGVKKYSVRVSKLPGELTSANNQRAFLARILKSKLRIVLIAGAPSADVSVIKQTLAEDKNFEVRSFTQNAQQTFYEGNFNAYILDSTDCFVLIGFPGSSTPDAVIDRMKVLVSERAIPFLFVNGKSVDERKLARLGSLLPFSPLGGSTGEQLVFIEVSSAHKNHPVLAINTDDGVEGWKLLPPIYKTQTSYKAKAEATVLATTKINTIVVNEPLLLLRNVNNHKCLAMLGYGVWRWRLMAQGTPQTQTILSTFLANTIRWLTTRDDNRPVKVTSVKDAFTQGESVEFVGQVYDASSNPVENAEVKLQVEQQGKTFETALQPIGHGRYEGTLEGLGSGDYKFHASATMDGHPMGDDRGRFSVGEIDLEFQDTRMNAQLLRQVAARTGGEFFTPPELGGLAHHLSQQVSFVPRDVHLTREFELWNWRYMLALVVLLFAVEWFVRKRSGML